MVSNEIKKAILAGVEAKALYLGNTLVWTRANVSIIVDTSDENVTVLTQNSGYQFTPRTYTTNPTGFENYVRITVDDSFYREGMLVYPGTHTIKYSYGNITSSYRIIVGVEEETPSVIPVSIIVNTDPIEGSYSSDADYYFHTVKEFITNPTGYESNVVIKVDNENYTNGVQLTTGRHTVSYTLADGEGYTGDSKSYQITVTQSQVTPEPTPVPEGGYYTDFSDDYPFILDPNNAGNRLEPVTSGYDYRRWYGVSENGKTFHYYAEPNTSNYINSCLTVDDVTDDSGSHKQLNLHIKRFVDPSNPSTYKTIHSTATNKDYSYGTMLVYSRYMFGKGRIDINAKMQSNTSLKSTIWFNSTNMEDYYEKVQPAGTARTGDTRKLQYLYEYDMVEYAPGDSAGGQGEFCTSRGMWVYQAGAQVALYNTRTIEKTQLITGITESRNTHLRNKATSIGRELTEDEKTSFWNMLLDTWRAYATVTVTQEDDDEIAHLEIRVLNTMLDNVGLETADPLPWLTRDANGVIYSLSSGNILPNTLDWTTSELDSNNHPVPKTYKDQGYWHLHHFTIITENGNRLIGSTNNYLYFVKWPVVASSSGACTIPREVSIHSKHLAWIKVDSSTWEIVGEGVGLDGNGYFNAPTYSVSSTLAARGVKKSYFIGTGENKTSEEFLVNNVPIRISDWHTWSLVVNNNKISYLCSGKDSEGNDFVDHEYWSIDYDTLGKLAPKDDTYAASIIFSTAKVTDGVSANSQFSINSIKFTPQEIAPDSGQQTPIGV